MIKRYGIVRESARRIAEAVDATVVALREGRVKQEPAFTDRMLGKIEHVMDHFEIKDVRWTAKTLTDRGPNAEERKFGADFMGVLTIDLPNFRISKGFLAQAKILKYNGWLPRDERKRLHEQCRKMLKITPDSFVFIYSLNSVLIVPANSVLNSVVNLDELYSRSVSRFFEEHFESFIGDPRISIPSASKLEELMAEYNARSALALKAKLKDWREEENDE